MSSPGEKKPSANSCLDKSILHSKEKKKGGKDLNYLHQGLFTSKEVFVLVAGYTSSWAHLSATHPKPIAILLCLSARNPDAPSHGFLCF